MNHIERINDQKPVYVADRAIPVGRLSIDPKTGWGKREEDNHWFWLAPKQLSLLRILDCGEGWVSVPEIALQYELAPDLNEAMILASSKKIIKEKISGIFEDLDKNYNEKNPVALGTSENIIHVQIHLLSEKIGFSMIENNRYFGYRLVLPPENEVTS